MGCGDACPVFPGQRYEDWVLDDPAGLDLDDVRPIRDEIRATAHHVMSADPNPIGSTSLSDLANRSLTNG
jgi:arsenate reductase (thioredoxin)